MADETVPPEIVQLLETSTIGYLSVRSPKGDLYSYPVAFYFSKNRVYFMTPIGAAKLRFIRSNPAVSFLVDNHQVTVEARGAMMQGDAKVFSIAKTVVSILSVGPKMVRFAKKYPGMFTFYAKGKELPDERKLYKYRLIRIDPVKVVYWTGYKFGKASLRGSRSESDPLAEAPDEDKMAAFASLLKTAGMADEELVPSPRPSEKPPEWNAGLKKATDDGTISRDELSTIETFRNFLRKSAEASELKPGVSDDERRLLARWKKNRPS